MGEVPSRCTSTRAAGAALAAALLLGSASCATGENARLERLFETRRENPDALRERLPDAIADRSPQVRAAAAWMTGELGGGEACLSLLPMLEDPAAEVRQAALKGLELLDKSGAACPDISAPVVRLLGDWEPAVRLGAIGRLVNSRAEVSPGLLLGASGDTDPEVREQAVRNLLPLEPFAGAVFIRLTTVALDDSDWHVRAAAAQALASFQSEEAGSVLELLLVDPSPLVRDEARKSLELVSTALAAGRQQQAAEVPAAPEAGTKK